MRASHTPLALLPLRSSIRIEGDLRATFTGTTEVVRGWSRAGGVVAACQLLLGKSQNRFSLALFRFTLCVFALFIARLIHLAEVDGRLAACKRIR